MPTPYQAVPVSTALCSHLRGVIRSPAGVTPHPGSAHWEHGVRRSPRAPHTCTGGPWDEIGGEEAREGTQLRRVPGLPCAEAEADGTELSGTGRRGCVGTREVRREVRERVVEGFEREGRVKRGEGSKGGGVEKTAG